MILHENNTCDKKILLSNTDIKLCHDFKTYELIE